MIMYCCIPGPPAFLVIMNVEKLGMAWGWVVIEGGMGMGMGNEEMEKQGNEEMSEAIRLSRICVFHSQTGIYVDKVCKLRSK